jgi:hypothetical protein
LFRVPKKNSPGSFIVSARTRLRGGGWQGRLAAQTAKPPVKMAMVCMSSRNTFGMSAFAAFAGFVYD